jgi:hypothetical protein
VNCSLTPRLQIAKIWKLHSAHAVSALTQFFQGPFDIFSISGGRLIPSGAIAFMVFVIHQIFERMN